MTEESRAWGPYTDSWSKLHTTTSNDCKMESEMQETNRFPDLFRAVLIIRNLLKMFADLYGAEVVGNFVKGPSIEMHSGYSGFCGYMCSYIPVKID